MRTVCDLVRLGGGTLRAGGSQATALQEVDVDVISNRDCYEKNGYTSSQIDAMLATLAVALVGVAAGTQCAGESCAAHNITGDDTGSTLQTGRSHQAPGGFFCKAARCSTGSVCSSTRSLLFHYSSVEVKFCLVAEVSPACATAYMAFWCCNT